MTAKINFPTCGSRGLFHHLTAHPISKFSWCEGFGTGSGSPAGEDAGILVEGLVETIPLLTEIPDCGRQVTLMIGEQTGKGLPAGTHEVFRHNLGVGLTAGADNAVEKMVAHEAAGADNAVEKMVAHEAVVGDAVEPHGGRSRK